MKKIEPEFLLTWLNSQWFNESILSVFASDFKGERALEVFQHLPESNVQKLIKMKDSNGMNFIFKAVLSAGGNPLFLKEIFQTQVSE